MSLKGCTPSEKVKVSGGCLLTRALRSARIVNSFTTAAEIAALSASRSIVRITGQHPIALPRFSRITRIMREVKATRREIFSPLKSATKTSISLVTIERDLNIICSTDACYTRDIILNCASSARQTHCRQLVTRPYSSRNVVRICPMILGGRLSIALVGVVAVYKRGDSAQ
jgi:hypothetical protein